MTPNSSSTKRISFEEFLENQISQEHACEEIFESLSYQIEPELEDIRTQIRSLRCDTRPDVRAMNVMLFGPSGAGKSSLIRTLFSAYNKKMLSSAEISEELVIKGSAENEGTRRLSRFRLSDSKQSVLTVDGKSYTQNYVGLHFFDTRGQIWFSKNEEADLDHLLAGTAKEGAVLTHRVKRNPMLAWEFWKSSERLYEESSLQAATINSQPHCVVFVLDGSVDFILGSSEEATFYKNVLRRCGRLGFENPIIIISKIDLYEAKLKEKLKKEALSEKQLEIKVAEEISNRMLTVHKVLDVPLHNIHYVQNYSHDNEARNLKIDYYALRTLVFLIKEAERFLKTSKGSGICNVF